MKLKQALGRSYSDQHLGEYRGQIIRRLSQLIGEPGMISVARQHHANLHNIVKSRSIGNRCGDYVSKVQFDLLSQALADYDSTKEEENAA